MSARQMALDEIIEMCTGWIRTTDESQELARAEVAQLRAQAARVEALEAALHDVDEPQLSTLAQSLRELANVIDPDDEPWIKWCRKQAAAIDAALAAHAPAQTE